MRQNGTIVVNGDNGGLTGVSMNGAPMPVFNGIADLGTVITSHQDISGKVDGPDSATNNAVAIFDGTGGKAVKDSGFTLGKSVPSDAVFTDTTYSVATTASDGLMSSTDKTKLDGVATGATANVGTITGITMNGSSKGTSGVVDLGTVITAHQDISGKVNKSGDTMTGTLHNNGGGFRKRNTTADITKSNNDLSENANNYVAVYEDKNLVVSGGFGCKLFTNGRSSAYMCANNKKTDGTTDVSNAIYANVDKDGTCTYSVSDPTAFRSAIGVTNKTAASGGTDISLVTTGDKYTWNNKSDLAIGTTATTAAAGNHTHTTTIAADSGTNQLTLAASTKYKITAGGTSYIFTTPPNTTYSSKTAASGGTDVSLCTTGEKYTWNSKLSSHQTIKQDGITGATVNRFGTCSTAAATAAKTVSITSGTFDLEAGSIVAVKFSNANTAASPTLNVNSKGAKNIFVNGAQITTNAATYGLLKGTVLFIYDGTQFHLIGNYYNSNTTYSAGTGLALSGTTFNISVPRVSEDANNGLPGINKFRLREYSSGANYNLPSNAWYYIFEAQGSDSNAAVQLALGETTVAAYYRYYSSGAWKAWYSLINTNTTYTAGANITLSGTTFSLTQANVISALGATPVYTSTDQTVAGTKTFSSIVYSTASGFRTIRGSVDLTKSNNDISSNSDAFVAAATDKNKSAIGGVGAIAFTDGRTAGYLTAANTKSDGTTKIYNSITTYITKDGTCSYGVSDQAAFRSAIGVVNRTAASGGTDLSLVTTGDKYTWNNIVSATTANVKSALGTGTNAYKFLRNDGTFQRPFLIQSVSANGSTNILGKYGIVFGDGCIWLINGTTFTKLSGSSTSISFSKYPASGTQTGYTISNSSSSTIQLYHFITN